MAAQLNVCIIGFGISARVFHAPFLVNNPFYTWSSVVERSANNASLLKADIKTYRSVEAALEDSTLDLFIITSPNETHYSYAKKILEAGKNVVIEKPFTNTSGEAKALIKTANQNQKILSVYQNRRYVSDFLTIKDILNEKLLGEIAEFEGHYDRYRPEAKPNAWREENKAGSGILYDLGSHLIDQALYLFGLPKNITADIRLQRPHAKVDDYFDIRLDYGFTKVILESGMLVREPGPRYMIHGTKGSFIKYGEDPQEAALRNGEMPGGADWGKEPASSYGLLHTEKEGVIIKKNIASKPGNYGQYYSNLYNTIVHNHSLKEKPEHGYNTIRLIELAIQSNKEKRTLPCTELINISYHD
ncbi:MAG: Gfo/Idh/MocA family oxidoreductase [Sphingobacteriales bacterium]|nr:Gfo/Idh/MocA family oxidoreductase [Sphingobacteriales bacterium]MBI3717965.1 Gfo/Idh/MocA family oxidoreductase [Sphingobacteriales bacterium]